MNYNINVHSEIGQLQTVLVHTPGNEIRRISPRRLDDLLFSAVIEPDTAIQEHQTFCQLLQEQNIEVVQLTDLTATTFDKANATAQNQFIETWLDQAEPKLTPEHRKVAKQYLLEQKAKSTLSMVRSMMGGIDKRKVAAANTINGDFLVDPMPNLYFTRDPFASIGHGISINRMKYLTRRRETLFASFILPTTPIIAARKFTLNQLTWAQLRVVIFLYMTNKQWWWGWVNGQPKLPLMF